jgi:glycosyltransferase involved in cell wall biosynthesis
VGGQFGTDRLRFIDACDAYISLSHRENFNFTATECLASGLPLILSVGNDIGEDLRPVGCGWMLGRGDAPAAAILAAGAAGSEKRAAMGAAGREWARSNLRYPEFAARVHDLAASVAATRR